MQLAFVSVANRVTALADDLPHLHALVAGIANPRRRRLWQRDIARRRSEDLGWQQRARAIDQVLADMNSAARETLLALVPGQIDQRNPARGWKQAFDHLNQARAYAHLAARGCQEIVFVAGSYAMKSPDLTAEGADGPVRCEVKTLHFSAPATPPDSVRRLARRLQDAAAQLAAVAGDAPTRRIAYVCLEFPAKEFDAADIAQHRAALEAFAEQAAPAGIEIVFDCIPAICHSDTR